MANPTIVVGHLDDKELRNSIDALVAYVGTKTDTMAQEFTAGLDKMKLAMKDFAITQQVSVTLMQEAWRKMSSSFDAMVAAQSSATGSGGGKPASYAPNTVGALEQEINTLKKERKEMELGSVELSRQNVLLEKRKKLLGEETSSPYKKIERSFTKEFGAANTMSTKTLQQAEDKLKRLVDLQNRFKNTGLIDEAKMNRLQNAIDNVRNKIEKLKTTKPMSIKQVLGMDDRSLEDIKRKMQAIATLRGQVDASAHPQVIRRLNDEYARLQKRQDAIMGTNNRLISSNNGIARSFNYIRNRIVYAFTIGAITNFAKSLMNVRAEYELLERSLGILTGSMEKGTQVFNELNEMAIKSPFTLIELGTAAKQLTAYNFSADEVVDTTRRLADISAALGVPMERLTYNLGQIKAQGVLNARDARDFANAGLAIVPMLAQLYTEQKRFGDQMVTTAQVYDMMSKKAVSYGDVLRVLYKITDEGGKFFNYQEKQADTLKVQLANLTLAYNNMLNEIGTENQGLFTGMVGGIKKLLMNWREVVRILLTLITTMGVYKTVSALAVNAGNIRAWLSLAKGITSAKEAMVLFNITTKANPLGLLISAISAVVSYFVLFKNSVEEASEEVEMFGESATKSIGKVKTLQKILQGTDDTSNTYKKTLSELSQIAKEYGVQIDAEKASRDDANKSAERTIELIKEESAERQRANQLEKSREKYETQTENVKADFTSALKELKGWFGAGSATRKELIDNADAISDVTSSIIEENLHLVVGKTEEEASKGLAEIRNKISGGLQQMGLSSKAISFLFNNKDIRNDLTHIINGYMRAANEQENYNQKIENYYQAAKKATSSTMTFEQKLEANRRALQNSASDAQQLYNRIYEIVDIAKKNHIINFDLRLTAQQPPKWMFSKDLPELKRLAETFAAIAKTGGRVKGHEDDAEYASLRALQYASAYRTQQEEAERKARENNDKNKTKSHNKEKAQKDKIAEAIKQEISLVKTLQKEYETLVKDGALYGDAIQKIKGTFGSTIDLLNKDLQKFGLPQLDLSVIKGSNPNDILTYFENLKTILESKGLGNLERMKAVEGVIQEFKVKAETYNLDMITKGLNAELGKLKDEYELAIELDANPELSQAFASALGLVPDTFEDLPNNLSEYSRRLQNIITTTLNKGYGFTDLQIPVLWDWRETLEHWAERVGIDTSSPIFAAIKKVFDSYRETVKKSLTDTEKVLDDYVKKYGDYSDKIAEIEADRLRKIKELNDAYDTAELKRRPEYGAKKNAIESGARKEMDKAAFEEFKNSRYYIAMFENLEYASTASLNTIRQKLLDLKDSLKDLSPEQLKWITQQFEKIDQELLSRNPFKGLMQNASAYFKSIGRAGKEAQKSLLNAQKDYDKQLKVVTAWQMINEHKKRSNELSREELNYISEQAGLESEVLQYIIGEFDINEMSTDAVAEQVIKEKELLKTLLKVLGVAEQANEEHDKARTLFGKQADEAVKQVAQNIKSLGELRDFLKEDLGIEMPVELDAAIDSFSKAGEGMEQVVSSIQSGNFIGAITGAAKTVYGFYDGIASLFGGGSARDRKITKKIQESERMVKRLELSYKRLEDSADKSYGAIVSGAQRATIANKELQLVEIKRQLELEKSRKKKKQDQDKIIDLQGQYEDLAREINNGTTDIVNELLGISSAGDGIEKLVQSMIDAFKSGEDAMEAFGKTWDTMIDNMVLKLLVTTYMQKAWDKLMSDLNKREEEMLKTPSEQLNAAQDAAKMSNDEIAKMIANQLGYTDIRGNAQQLQSILKRGKIGGFGDYTFIEAWQQVTDEEIDAYRNNLMTVAQQNLDNASIDFTKWSLDYMKTYGYDYMKQQAELLKDGIGDWYTFGQDNTDKQLSALQQGIQGITEDTAGALEAITNGISQQCYLQSDILIQIRDTVQSFDIDIQTASLSQILLQLQSSYQLQQSMLLTMENWTNPSGNAVRVELIS